MITLSIIIVNYRSPDLILDCLQTVYAETNRTSFEVIVVDNHSEDQSRERLVSAYPGMQWIQMGYNAGFARANNEGIRQAKGSLILLLNPDTLILDHAIDRCCEMLVQSSHVACGVQLINPDRTPQISGNYFMPGGLNNLLPLPYLGNFLSGLGRRLRVKAPHVPEASETLTVDWINGAFLMVRKAAISAAGMMDEDFFLYAEEAEWCYRLARQGSLALFGEIRVIHLQGETAARAFSGGGKGYYDLYTRRGLQIMVSNFVRIRKQFGAGWFLFHLMIYTMEVPVFFLGLVLSRLTGFKKSPYTFSDLRLFISNLASLWALSLTILRNRPHFYKML